MLFFFTLVSWQADNTCFCLYSHLFLQVSLIALSFFFIQENGVSYFEVPDFPRKQMKWARLFWTGSSRHKRIIQNCLTNHPPGKDKGGKFWLQTSQSTHSRLVLFQFSWDFFFHKLLTSVAIVQWIFIETD